MDNIDHTETVGPVYEVFPSPIKKNKPGKLISFGERIRIIIMYKTKLKKYPNITAKRMNQIISKAMNVSESTVYRTIVEYNATNTVTSPNRKKVRENIFDLYDEFAINAVRKHVYNIWFRREIPTVDKLHKAVSDDVNLPAISRINFLKLIKNLNFRYCKSRRNSTLTEKNKIVVWRRRYLRTIQQYRKQGRHIYYLDEMWVNASDYLKNIESTIQNKNKRLIVRHIGSEDGFVSGGLLCFEKKKHSRDFNNEMNRQIFYEWMKDILPRLQDNSVIVMDNTPYRSVKKENIPTSTTKKDDIIYWLVEKGEVIDSTMVIPELMEIVKRIKSPHDEFVIDELAKAHNITILRLPPYHSELNPIKLAWSSVKNYIRMIYSLKLSDVIDLLIDGIEKIDAEMWKTFISRTKEKENTFWKIDNIVEEVLAEKISNSTMTITRDTSSDSESD